MSYQIALSGEAEKHLDRLESPTRKRILQRLSELGSNPFDPRISKLLAQALGKRSSRVGGWRVIYQVDRPARHVQIIAILPRGRAYRRLG